ncbi:hypothetical protein KOR34_50320 [Posidoniimonas corsicana]|uniref:Uncharacterized protein n=1 Tax=Posidoniimonas corsicana TaxID=1938618 RepID=A0A5C5UXV6_9BACT|nr:hypothetical protein [Posidoniimonas corsicana]TWT30473.1 hypothetical protein KOR34_50320 [Posidoniimonas corsicana]
MARIFMPAAFSTLASVPRAIGSLAAANCRAALCCAALTAPCGAALAAQPVEVYDSGWAVASPLGPSRVKADRVVGERVLEKLRLPSKPDAPTDDLRWRPVRTAQRPGAAPSHDGAPPPLPLNGQEVAGAATAEPSEPLPLAAPDGPQLNSAFRVPHIPDTQAAPESQSLPEQPAQLPSSDRPAPFAAESARPLNDDAPTSQPAAEEPADEPKPAPSVSEPAREPAKLTPPKEQNKPEQPAKPEAKDEEAPARTEPAPVDKPKQAPPKAAAEQAPATETDADDEATETEEARQQRAGSSSRRPSPDFTTPKEVEKPQRELKPLSRNQMSLRRRLRSVLSYYYRRPLNSVDHDSWEVMHSMLSYGLYSRVQDGGRRGKPVTAVGYLCFNKPCNRYQMLYLTPEGNLDVRVGVGMQGHKGQLLAMLAQCNVSPDYPMRVEGQDFTVRDLVAAEQLTCYARSELTFKLIGLMHYLPSDSTWVNDQGEHWDFPKLIADERTQKIRGAACGGTHRLSGLALAAKKRVARGEPLDGEWAEAAKFVEEYQQYAFRLQNRDGSLSTEWFRGPGDEDDVDRRIRTTGHILEWLIYSLPEEDLDDRRVFAAVNYLTNLITSNTDNGWEIGPLAHALHALALYDEKVFLPYDNPDAAQVAGRTNRPVKLNYKELQSGISENYYYIQARHEEREERRGLGGLFGFGSSSRRSR